MNEKLFSYGTLQLENVQIETFGRKLNGVKARLLRYKLAEIEISDLQVIAKSNKKYHPIAKFTGIDEDFIDGVIYEITKNELLLSDTYEVKEYERINEIFSEDKNAWIYVCRETNNSKNNLSHNS